jgi:hypothetical protein
MTKKVSPARDHIRLIEARIEQQIVENERLKSLGQDATAGERRLFLLHRALEEMRVQLGSLSPTDLDSRRADIAIALKMLSAPQRRS